MQPGTVTLGSRSQYSPGQVAGGNIPLQGEAPGQGHVTIGPGGTSYDQNAIANQQRSSALDAQTQSLLKSIAGMQSQLANRPLAPTLDISGIRSAASAAAEQNVNPLYSQKLNNYLQNEAAQKTALEGKTTSDIGNLQAQLANTLAGTGLQRTSTQQNTEAGLADIAAQQSNYLRTQGTNFENQRQGLLNTEGTLSGSGLGQQKDIQAQVANQNTEAAQQQQYKYSAQQKQLYENQTFAQLANSDQLSQLKETEGENTAKFNLNDYLRQASYGEQTFRQQNELDRNAAVLAQTAQGTSKQVADFISSFKNNPALYNAAIQAYGAIAGAGG